MDGGPYPSAVPTVSLSCDSDINYKDRTVISNRADPTKSLSNLPISTVNTGDNTTIDICNYGDRQGKIIDSSKQGFPKTSILNSSSTHPLSHFAAPPISKLLNTGVVSKNGGKSSPQMVGSDTGPAAEHLKLIAAQTLARKKQELTFSTNSTDASIPGEIDLCQTGYYVPSSPATTGGRAHYQGMPNACMDSFIDTHSTLSMRRDLKMHPDMSYIQIKKSNDVVKPFQLQQQQSRSFQQHHQYTLDALQQQQQQPFDMKGHPPNRRDPVVLSSEMRGRERDEHLMYRLQSQRMQVCIQI